MVQWLLLNNAERQGHVITCYERLYQKSRLHSFGVHTAEGTAVIVFVAVPCGFRGSIQSRDPKMRQAS